METALKKVKAQFEEIAGRWNGDDVVGEDVALSAKDIIDKIDSIEKEKEDWRRIGNDITRGLDELEKMLIEYKENYNF